ncbi:MAG: 50S ribosomal protein L29 [Patescibacteria group bacterium]|mgnify:FL=1
MKIRELKTKAKEELEKIFEDVCAKRQQMGFKADSKQLKNIREFREVKKTIARMLTIAKERGDKLI